MVIDKNKWVASIDSKRCIDCGHCNSVCPSFGLQLQHLNEPLLDGELNAYIGNYRNCYYGFSEDQQIRLQASSGGIVTELLITALEKGLIDGAFVVRAAMIH
jgi:coenzyme F420 hydrogenase subunit beta